MKQYEVLWYERKENEEIIHTKEFSSVNAALNFYKKIKVDSKFYDFWITKRNKDWEIIKDIII